MALVVSACGSSTSNSGAAASDSAEVAADTVPAVETVKPLPDTMYSSASAVKFSVTRLDTVSPMAVDNLTDLYADAPGAFTFRKGMTRQADFGGHVTGNPSEVVVDWTFVTGTDNRSTGFGSWGGGTGWTGQPLYVEWPDSTIARFKAAGQLTADFGRREVIVGSLAGRVYFINYETGKSSREAIPVGNPIKGTISLDPTLNGNLYVGHGVPAERPFGAVVIDLNAHQVVDVFGEDPRAQRRWGAYDSSALRLGQFVFRPGENGTFYKLNVAPGRVSIHSTLRYTVNGAAPGIESSMSIYRNYGFIADNAGNILGVNLDTMKPVWLYRLGDDIDASMTLEIEDGVPYLYVGCEVDKQGTGTANLVKLNALDGKEMWLNRIPARRANVGEKHFDGGYYGTVLPGTGDCSDLIFANCVLNTDGQNGVFAAFKRSTGETVYTTRLKYYSWSSPVGFLNEEGKLTVFTADCSGNVYLISPRDGNIIFSKRIGNNFESSPVVTGNTLILGSRGDKIYRMSIK